MQTNVHISESFISVDEELVMINIQSKIQVCNE